jgi:predicted TPR repeat methyltransferase
LLPKRAVGYWALAEAYEAAGEMTLAGEHFRKAVEVEPSDKLAKRKLKAWQAYLSEDGNET